MSSSTSARAVATNSRNSYLESLESAWAEHLKPKATDAPTVISTFAGGGGSSLGYSIAGYRELLTVEWDQNAVDTLRLNFPHIPIYHGDIAKLSVEECLKLAGIKPGELDVFDGSPPCQGFSTVGKRQIDDPRNSLFREYVRLLRGLKSKAFVMENVSGMVKGKMKPVFAEILRELKASGYRVKARLLNAMYFGVPQSRQRMIFIGVREDLGIEPGHPKGNPRITTLGDAGFTRTIGIKPDVLANNPYHDGRKRRFSPRDVCATLTKHGGFGVGRNQCDAMTLDELKRIASYPGAYRMAGSFDNGWDRIGNSVPPFFMRAIANHIRAEILDSRPGLLAG